MEDLAWAWRIFGSCCQEYPILGKEPHPPHRDPLPPPPVEIKILSGLGTLSFELPGIPPPPLPSVWRLVG